MLYVNKFFKLRKKLIGDYRHPNIRISRQIHHRETDLNLLSDIPQNISRFDIVLSNIICLSLTLPVHTVSAMNCTLLRCIARRCKYNDERPTVLQEHVAQSDTVGYLIILKTTDR